MSELPSSLVKLGRTTKGMSCREEKVEEDDDGDDQEIEICICSNYAYV